VQLLAARLINRRKDMKVERNRKETISFFSNSSKTKKGVD